MMDWTLVFVADIVVGESAREPKKRRMREEMVAVGVDLFVVVTVSMEGFRNVGRRDGW